MLPGNTSGAKVKVSVKAWYPTERFSLMKSTRAGGDEIRHRNVKQNDPITHTQLSIHSYAGSCKLSLQM